MMFVRATFERKADVAEEDMKMIQSLDAAAMDDPCCFCVCAPCVAA